MKRFTFFILYLFITTKILGQLISFNFNNKEGINYYKKGVLYLQTENYKTADSLFSLALCTYKNKDLYFDRGISKLYMYDTLGFCFDMNIAANKYFDKEANKLFNTYCCKKIDTIYYNKKFIRSTNNKYRYFEEVKYFKYDTIILGIIHDIKTEVPEFNIDFGCDNAILGMNNNTSDIIGIYLVEDSVKYYLRSTKVPSISNTNSYEKIINKAKKYFSIKYSDIKKEYKLDTITVYYYIMISETGEVLNIEFADFFPEVSFEFSTQEINKDFSDLAKQYPKLSPAKFKKMKVKSKVIDGFSF